MSDTKFEVVVARCLHRIVSTLRCSQLQDHLRAELLINREEYSLLSSLPTEEQRARLLLHEILPKKGPGTYETFCQVLLRVSGQEHIVWNILEPTEEQVGEQAAAGRLPLQSNVSRRDEEESSECKTHTEPVRKKKRLVSSSGEQNSVVTVVLVHCSLTSTRRCTWSPCNR